MTNKIQRLSLILLATPSISVAGLFGPSNYEECILANMKDAKSDTAAQIVAGACADKFPTKAETAKSPLKISFDFYNKGNGNWSGMTNKLTFLELKGKGNRDQLRVMNNYSFDVIALSIGIVKSNLANKACPNNYSGYKEVVSCQGYASGKHAGNFDCDTIKGTYCVTGFTADFGNLPEKEALKLIKQEVDIR